MSSDTEHTSDTQQDGKFHREPGWAENPVFLNLFLACHIIACVLAAIAGFIWKKDKAYFAITEFPVFYGIYGFLVFAGIVLIGQHLRRLVGKSDTYYEERE